MSIHYPRYDTMTEFIDKVRGNDYGGTDSYDAEFTGTPNYERALELAEDGWTEMRPTVDAVRESIMGSIAEVIDFESTVTLDLVGGAVDMGAFMAGEPEHMIAFPMDERDTMDRVVRIIMDPGGASGVPASQLAARAAAVAALLEIVQMSGRSLEVWVASPVKARNYQQHSPVICAHRAGTECDINAMMFFCGHPSMLRRLIFSHRDMDGIGSDMGTQIGISDELAESVGADVRVSRPRFRDTAAGEPDAGVQPEAWVIWQCEQIGLIG